MRGVIKLVKTKTRPWRHIYHDIGIPRPENYDTEIPGPKMDKKPRYQDSKTEKPQSAFVPNYVGGGGGEGGGRGWRRRGSNKIIKYIRREIFKIS